MTVAGRHEEEVGEILFGSAVFLSLAHREGLGMAALEAMASGGAVIGFHGTGGLDYAAPENGRWFGSDEAIACADAVADVGRRLERGDPAVAAMIAAGQATAAASRSRSPGNCRPVMVGVTHAHHNRC
ncbi:glycosyltransferase [Azospirillum sp. A1-3]|uniref:glycosyltransferase n=1 Tax=Azospirillum sp. A1-3 TaxID=185874 RepID=UPI0020778741|nr:glycosyltransferase [Azospirillum sp. A1-3]